METIWFWIVAVMLTSYVILDGFDIGAGIVHYFVGRAANERETVIAATGPVRDGNEVWLLATGGTQYVAFPALYAATFRCRYLPLLLVFLLFQMLLAAISPSPATRSFLVLPRPVSAAVCGGMAGSLAFTAGLGRACPTLAGLRNVPKQRSASGKKTLRFWSIYLW